jgi:hypothetical protein
VSEEPSRNATGDRVVVDVSLYALARLLLAVIVGAGIYGVARLLGVAQFPIVVAALFALIIAMPLGIWVFAPLRRRATASLAVAGERRHAEREKLRARLRGEVPPDEAPADGAMSDEAPADEAVRDEK